MRVFPQPVKPIMDLIGPIGTTEVVPFQNRALNRVLQGLKPNPHFIGSFGPTKVRPCYKALRIRLLNEFFRSL